MLGHGHGGKAGARSRASQVLHKDKDQANGWQHGKT